MIALYARQSIDKKDSISIDTQIEFCKHEIGPNDEYKVYQDKGYSGKNTDRPSFQQMLTDVKSGIINKVIVYRLDRISRSITDFAGIMDILSEHDVDFVSSTEKFDTSAPMGRAMLYIVMVFAQLERETIAERIRDNYYSRGKTGVWLGGPAPFGYENIKTTVSGKTISTIQENPETIEIIKNIFDRYAYSSDSLGAIAKDLKQTYGDKYGIWNNIKLSRLLHNPVYVKANADVYSFFKQKKCIMVNDIEDYTNDKGLIVYGKRDHAKNKWNALSEHVIALSVHTGVIDSDTFLRCQYKLDQNQQIKNTGKGKYTWLTGFVKCGYCGYSLNCKYTSYKGEKKYYLRCSGTQTNECTHGYSISISDVETFVENEIKYEVTHFDQNKFRNQNKSLDAEINDIKIELYKIEEQIENLINNLATANSTVSDYINKKILELDLQKTELQNKLQKETVSKNNVILPDLTNWDSMSVQEKHNTAAVVIDKIFVYEDKISIKWLI